MKSALVVVDVQNYFIGKDFKDLPKKIASHIENSRGRYDFVLFAQFVNDKDSNFVKLFGWGKCTSPPETDISPELQSFASVKNTFRKSTFSPFKSEKFVKFLKENGVGKVVVCGTDTEAYIYSSAIDAFDMGFVVEVLIDLCGSSHGKAAHETGMRLFKENLWGCIRHSKME